ncbi:MAG: hypothetical protein AVDCRST_MAG38-1933, partial [uncultured Solirubrobacteraceae bacterium]
WTPAGRRRSSARTTGRSPATTPPLSRATRRRYARRSTACRCRRGAWRPSRWTGGGPRCSSRRRSSATCRRRWWRGCARPRRRGPPGTGPT